jgi:PRTRC genetic system protein C
METTTLEREFKFEKDGKPVTLPDPNPDYSIEEVMQYYSTTYPELTTAKFDEPKVEGSKVIHKVRTTVGTKG